MIQCNLQTELYSWLSKMVTGSGNYIAQQGEIVEKFFGQHMKYHLKEHETFREIQQFREQAKNAFVKIDRSLLEKKEKLFKQKDLYKWGGFQDNLQLQKMQDELVQNKEKAFLFMLPKETKEMESKKEELGFLTN